MILNLSISKKIKSLIFELLQYLYSFLLFTLFFIAPKLIFLVSKEKYTVPKKYRWVRKKEFLDDWLFLKKEKKTFSEANIIFRGDSFQRIKNKIDYNIPTFFVNFDDERIEDKPNYFCLTSRSSQTYKDKNLGDYIKINTGFINLSGAPHWGSAEVKNKFKKNGFQEIADVISNNGVINKNNTENLNLCFGTGLISIALVSNYFEKINIFGWDYYLKKDIEKLSFFETFNFLFNRHSPGYLFKKSKNYKLPERDFPTKRKFFSIIINWYYANLLRQSPRFKIFSYMEKIDQKKFFLRKIDKILIR